MSRWSRPRAGTEAWPRPQPRPPGGAAALQAWMKPATQPELHHHPRDMKEKRKTAPPPPGPAPPQSHQRRWNCGPAVPDALTCPSMAPSASQQLPLFQGGRSEAPPTAALRGPAHRRRRAGVRVRHRNEQRRVGSVSSSVAVTPPGFRFSDFHVWRR